MPFKPYLESPHGQLFPAEGLLYNQQQEELEKVEEVDNPLGLIGRMFQTKLEENNPDLALQQKFEGISY